MPIYAHHMLLNIDFFHGYSIGSCSLGMIFHFRNGYETNQNPWYPAIIGFVWKCWVYSQWNSHLLGIMISKTIGFRGTRHFQTHPIEHCRHSQVGCQEQKSVLDWDVWYDYFGCPQIAAWLKPWQLRWMEILPMKQAANYPLVMSNIAIENGHWNSGFTH